MTISAACVICVDHPCGHALALVWWRRARAKAAGSIAPREIGAVAVQDRNSGGCGGGFGLLSDQVRCGTREKVY